MGHKPPVTAAGVDLLSSPSMPPYEGRSTHKLRLVELSAFMEQTRDLTPENVRKIYIIVFACKQFCYIYPFLLNYGMISDKINLFIANDAMLHV